jgi:acyl-CoA thioester hydrolase
MGFVYHGNYLVWLDIARTEHLRRTGVTYKDMEERGVFLAVTEARIRYRLAARYDDVVRIRCWVRDLASRRVVFGYAVERAGTAELLATAETSLIALDRRRALSRVPADVTERLHAIPDPVRL